jgi:acyl-CoA synthetase (NDP forming)
MTIRHLDALNHPQSIAVIGGSSKAGSLGTRVATVISAVRPTPQEPAE